MCVCVCIKRLCDTTKEKPVLIFERLLHEKYLNILNPQDNP